MYSPCYAGQTRRSAPTGSASEKGILFFEIRLRIKLYSFPQEQSIYLPLPDSFLSPPHLQPGQQP